jgi:thiamine pyrophosphate-dependent acetolactate synthase large subunit-like protein
MPDGGGGGARHGRSAQTRLDSVDLLQRQIYGRGDFETDLVNPDLPALAAAYGVAADRVDTPRGLEQALSTALATREMWVIEVAASFSNNPFARF